MTLHIPTMVVMAMVASIVLAGALSVVAWGRLSDLRSWAWALGMQAIAMALIALRGQVPDLLSIVLANTLVSMSMAMYAIGLCRFDGWPVPWWAIAVPVALTAFGFAILIDDYRARVLWGGIVWLGQTVHVLWLLYRPGRRADGRGRHVLAGAVVVFMLTLVYRIVALPTGLDPATHLTHPTPLTMANYLASNISTALLAVGALAMILERAERIARDNEQRHRRLIEAAAEGILVVEDGRIRLANPRFATMTGQPADELVGRPFLELVHPDDRALAAEAHRRRLEGASEGTEHEIRCLTRHRGERWFRVSGVAIDWQGHPATLSFVSDVTEQRVAAERIRDLAYQDTLTRLPNRRMLLDHLQMAIAANARSGRHGAIVFMDLDNFKPLNDQHGHTVGDQLLVEVARRLRGAIRATDTAARFGGDEFVVLLGDLSLDPTGAREQARQLTDKLLATVAEPYRLQAPHGELTRTVEHRCTASAGIVVFAGDGVHPGDLLDRADAAMYAAKQAGRGRSAFEPAGG